MTAWHLTLTSKHNQTALIEIDGFISSIVQKSLQAYLEAELTEYIGAEPYERTDGRIGMRNGHKPRTLKLTVGTIGLMIPQTRDSGFHTELFERYQRSERAFTLAIIEMYLDGVSTRKVSEVTEALCGVSFSKSTVSELCKKLDEQVNAWKSRDLSAHTYPYILVDALYENIRKDGAVVSEGVLIVCGVRDDGKREILDAVIADTESAATYNDLFSSLKERGLHGVRMVTSDAHSGLKAAIRRYFQGASWQRCQVHFMRDALGKVSSKRRRELGGDISAIFAETERDKAMAMASEVADKWRSVSSRAAAMIEDDIEQCLSVLALPEEHHPRLRTNNTMERLNKEIRRRDQVIEVFPNEASALRLICAICMEQSEEWLSGRLFLDMSLLDVDDAPILGDIESIKPRRIKKAS